LRCSSPRSCCQLALKALARRDQKKRTTKVTKRQTTPDWTLTIR